MDEEDEFLKRFYKSFEYNKKLTLLTEYYKYHRDITRIFFLPASKIVIKYYHKIR